MPGPFCAALLADLGADVIRVEKVRGGEDRFLMPVTEAGDGAYYLQVNRGKRGMTLNPRTPEGRHVLQRLVAQTDVVVANLPDAALKSLGLDYDALSTVKPDVILTSVSAFGAGGPSSHRLGFDGIGQAMSGIMYLSGRPGEPTKAYCPYVDFTTALVATVGTLAALLVRRDTGQGQHVRASLLASALTIANGMLMEQAMNPPGPGGHRQPQPDAGAVGCLPHPRRLGAGAVHRPAAIQAGGRSSSASRTGWTIRASPTTGPVATTGRRLSERMAEWCGERTTDEALAALDAARIPAGPVLSPQQVLDDAHVQAIGFLRSVASPGAEVEAPVAETPFSLSAAPAGIRGRAPGLGEHTDAILADLGYSPPAVAALHQRGVV